MNEEKRKVMLEKYLILLLVSFGMIFTRAMVPITHTVSAFFFDIHYPLYLFFHWFEICLQVLGFFLSYYSMFRLLWLALFAYKN